MYLELRFVLNKYDLLNSLFVSPQLIAPLIHSKIDSKRFFGIGINKSGLVQVYLSLSIVYCFFSFEQQGVYVYTYTCISLLFDNREVQFRAMVVRFVDCYDDAVYRVNGRRAALMLVGRTSPPYLFTPRIACRVSKSVIFYQLVATL